MGLLGGAGEVVGACTLFDDLVIGCQDGDGAHLCEGGGVYLCLCVRVYGTNHGGADGDHRYLAAQICVQL